MQPQLTKKGMKKTTILSIDQKINQSNRPIEEAEKKKQKQTP
jgi:hypothetical protein